MQFENDPRNAQVSEEKLPVWAQERLAWLRRKILHLEDVIASRDDSTPTTIAVNAYSNHPQYLPDGSIVRWQLAENDWIEVRMTERGLQIMGDGIPLAIEPQVTNVMTIRQAQHW